MISLNQCLILFILNQFNFRCHPFTILNSCSCSWATFLASSSVCGCNHFCVKKIKKLFQSISRLYEKRFFSDFQFFHFSAPLKVDDTVNDFLIWLYSILYEILSSSPVQKYFTVPFLFVNLPKKPEERLLFRVNQAKGFYFCFFLDMMSNTTAARSTKPLTTRW